MSMELINYPDTQKTVQANKFIITFIRRLKQTPFRLNMTGDIHKKNTSPKAMKSSGSRVNHRSKHQQVMTDDRNS